MIELPAMVANKAVAAGTESWLEGLPGRDTLRTAEDVVDLEIG